MAFLFFKNANFGPKKAKMSQNLLKTAFFDIFRFFLVE